MSLVSVHLGSSLRAHVDTADHQFFVDEPVEAGGENSGPSPYEFLLAALGACTAMTLRLYADRKQWDLQRVRVELSHERQHLKDCEDCTGEEKGPFLDRVARRVHLEGNLDDEQRARLLEIAERCPVHRTLTGTVRITSELA